MQEILDKYPMLLIPSELLDVIQKQELNLVNDFITEQIGEQPIEPQKPKYIYPPSSPYFSNASLDIAKLFFKILIGVILFALFIIVISKFNEAVVSLFLFIYAIPIIFLLLKISTHYSEHIDKKEKYKIEHSRYLNEMNEFNLKFIKYRNDFEAYSEDKKDYDEHCQIYEKKKNSIINNKQFFEKFNKFKNQQELTIITDFSKEISKPTESEMKFQIGISEKFFLKYLENYFVNSSIKRHLVLEYYEPDFTIELENGILIDIEIDEPYSGNTKEIIHYYDNSEKKFSDSLRNQFFLSCNWVVIRFSEQQIIEDPDSCCKFIATVMIFLQQKIDFKLFKDIEDIKPLNIWSKKEANEMAYFDYRKKYLNDNMLNNII